MNTDEGRWLEGIDADTLAREEQDRATESTHLQDCPLSLPCREQKWTGEHRQSLFNKRTCSACQEVCICERLRAHGKRVLTEAREAVARFAPHDEQSRESTYIAGVEDGYNTAVREHVAAIDRLIEAQS